MSRKHKSKWFERESWRLEIDIPRESGATVTEVAATLSSWAEAERELRRYERNGYVGRIRHRADGGA